MLQVNPLEGFWALASLTGLVATLILLGDSWTERQATLVLGNGRQAIRMLIVRGNIRRELLRLLIQVLAGVAVIPGLFRPGEIVLVFNLSTDELKLATAVSIAVLSLIAIPFVLMASSIADARDRKRLRSMTIDVLRVEKIVRADEISHAEDAVRAEHGQES